MVEIGYDGMNGAYSCVSFCVRLLGERLIGANQLASAVVPMTVLAREIELLRIIVQLLTEVHMLVFLKVSQNLTCREKKAVAPVKATERGRPRHKGAPSFRN